MSLHEQPSQPNDEQQVNRARTLRESALEGQTPQDFIVSNVDELRKISVRAKISKYDIAYAAQFWIDQGVITEQEVEESVDRFGLSRDEEIVFISKTMPEIREYMEQERQKEREEAENRRKEKTLQYEQHWGLQRLDQISNYYQRQQNQLNRINPSWGDAISRYQNRRDQLEQRLQQQEDPTLRAEDLMEELYYLTFLHPSEAEKIFQIEVDTKSYVYLDSLMEASKAMFQTTSGKDPDLDTIHYGSGNIGVSRTYYSIDDPESMKRNARSDVIENLVYGAKTPSETRRPWKKQITPFKPIYERSAPDQI